MEQPMNAIWAMRSVMETDLPRIGLRLCKLSWNGLVPTSERKEAHAKLLTVSQGKRSV